MSQILSAVTYNARCARALLDILLHSLQRQPTKPPSPDRTLLFALAPSLTTSPEVLSEITSTLTQFYPKHVGCISAPLPYQYVDSGKRNGPHLCSLAYALVDGVPFHSTISGRTQAQVGRWHAARQRRTEDANGAMQVDTEDSQMRISEFCRSDGKVNWENVWDHAVTSSSSHGVGLGSKTLPEALRNLEYVCFFSFSTHSFANASPVSPSARHNILYFSDKAPEGLATLLQSAFPQANKVCNIAASVSAHLPSHNLVYI